MTRSNASKLAVIYLPGLGDGNPRGQRWLVRTWRLWGVKPVFCQMNWADGEAWEPKLQKIIEKIDALADRGYRVGLVGASAGAGAAVNAFAARKDVVVGLVCICGKVNRPEAIGKHYRTNNPAFVESAYQVQSSLDRLDFDTDRPRIQSRYALFDPIVPKADSEIPGAHNRMVLSVGHAITIATQLLFGAPFYLRFLKSQA